MSQERLLQLLTETPKKDAHPELDEPTEEIETVSEDDDDGDDTPAEVVPISRVTGSNFFRHPDTHPIVLDLALLKKYGPDFLGWEPETLEIRIPQDFKVDSISDLNMAKINAAKTLHLVDTYWERWEVFNWCTMAFNGIYPDFDILQVPTVSQILVSADIANRLRDDVEWGSEVSTFIATTFRFEGVLCPQPPVEFVEIDTEGLPVDCAEVSKRWPKVKETKEIPRGDNVIDEQLRRMLLAYYALEESRENLRAQLQVIPYV